MLERHRHLIATNTRVAGGMDGKKRNRQLRIVNATGDRPFPIVPGADLLVIDPDLVPPVFQVRLETIHQFAVRIVAIGEENALRFVRLGGEWSRCACTSRRSLSLEALLADMTLPLRGFGLPGGVRGGAVGAGRGHWVR